MERTVTFCESLNPVCLAVAAAEAAPSVSQSICTVGGQRVRAGIRAARADDADFRILKRKDLDEIEALN